MHKYLTEEIKLFKLWETIQIVTKMDFIKLLHLSNTVYYI